MCTMTIQSVVTTSLGLNFSAQLKQSKFAQMNKNKPNMLLQSHILKATMTTSQR